jgi:hypothetical protein
MGARRVRQTFLCSPNWLAISASFKLPTAPWDPYEPRSFGCSRLPNKPRIGGRGGSFHFEAPLKHWDAFSELRKFWSAGADWGRPIQQQLRAS